MFIYGEKNRRVNFDLNSGEIVKVEDIKKKACELFGLSACQTQLWDRDFEDWVDADDHEEV